MDVYQLSLPADSQRLRTVARQFWNCSIIIIMASAATTAPKRRPCCNSVASPKFLGAKKFGGSQNV